MFAEIAGNFLLVSERSKSFDSYQMVPDLTLSFMVSGKKELRFSDRVIYGQSGSIGLIRKNELLKSIKMVDQSGLDYESISIFFRSDVLRAYANRNNIQAVKRHNGSAYIDLTKSSFLQAYFQSLLPYLTEPNKLTAPIASLKTNEALELLIAHDSNLEQFVFDLSEPHKVDLEEYMNANFTFNVPIKEFARLTGRSISTFKRDFSACYHATPEKWLKEKRLEEARFLITERGQKSSEAYFNAGFENFAHFSTAFKERFGVSPSKLRDA